MVKIKQLQRTATASLPEGHLAWAGGQLAVGERGGEKGVAGGGFALLPAEIGPPQPVAGPAKPSMPVT